MLSTEDKKDIRQVLAAVPRALAMWVTVVASVTIAAHVCGAETATSALAGIIAFIAVMYGQLGWCRWADSHRRYELAAKLLSTTLATIASAIVVAALAGFAWVGYVLTADPKALVAVVAATTVIAFVVTVFARSLLAHTKPDHEIGPDR